MRQNAGSNLKMDGFCADRVIQEECRVLRRVLGMTTEDYDVEGILHEIVKVVARISKADSVFVYLFDAHRQYLVLSASKMPRNKELGRIKLKVGEGLTGWALKNKSPVVIARASYDDPRFKAFDLLPEDKYESFLALPIVFKGKPVGVINFQHKEVYEYPSRVLDLLGLIASQVGGAIAHARLFDEARLKALQFDSLIKVSQAIVSQRYIDEILRLVVLVTAQMLDSKICSIMLVDQKGTELVMRATQSLSEAYKNKPNLKVNSSLMGEVVRRKSALVVENVQHEKMYCYRDLAAKEGLTSMLAVPMVIKGRALGVVSVYTKEARLFSRSEIGVLQIVANQAAAALENTQLMEESVRAKEALETRRVVELARAALMRMQHISEDAAYRLIHRKAMDRCKTMKETAESILLAAEIQQENLG